MIPAINTEHIDAAAVRMGNPSLTYKLDFNQGKVVGKIDQLEAVKQAVLKVLETDRFYHPIYSWNYGHELKKLIGTDPMFVSSELQRLVKEALMTDDRIEAIDSFKIIHEGDAILAQFTVTTIYGAFDEEVRTHV